MKMLFTAITLMIASPALAQTAPATNPHAGHAMPAQKAQSNPHAHHGTAAAPKPAATCTPEHAAMGHCKLVKPAPAAKRDPHAAHKTNPQK